MANYLMRLTHEQVPMILSATYFDALSKQAWLKIVLRDINVSVQQTHRAYAFQSLLLFCQQSQRQQLINAAIRPRR